MTQLDKLDIGEVSELTTGKKEDFRVKVEEKDLSLQDLKALKEAEKSGQNRDSVLEFLDSQIDTKNISNHLDVAERDTEDIEQLVEEIEKIEDVESFEEESIDIDQDELIDLVGGTVDEMKEFVDEKPLTGEQLKDILDAEQRVKNRKTAKSFLEKELEKKQVEEDVSTAKKDLENVKEDLENLKDDKDIEDTEEPEDDVENQEGNEDVEESEEPTEQKEEHGDDEEETEEPEDNGEGEEDSEKDSETEEDQEEEDGEEESGEESKLEQKKSIADELELSMTEDELESISLDELKNLKQEKMHREHLIDHLKDEGMEEEKLRNSSTADLEKIADSMKDDSDSQEEHEEMREEAEEDLEMLMGAVKNKESNESTDDGKNAKEKLEDFKESIHNKLQRSSDEEETSEGIKYDRVQEILDQYRNLDDEEAAVKTAHVMKGYLEQELGIEREMTYKELADKMPTEKHEEVENLANFFLKMHREQYTGQIAIDDSEEVIDTCEKVIENLS